MNITDIKDPSFLYDMSNDELNKLANDIRKFMLEKVSVRGGHIGGNLGIVELTIALHKYFNHGEKFIFDVGHQCYTHKILTGRAKDFDNLRSKDGISGFPLRSESKYDSWDVAHASTSLAALAGYIEAGKEAIAVIGDGALTGGVAIEALEYISTLNKKAIIILNDNSFSISPNVGFIRKLLDSLRSTRGYKDISSKNREHEFLKAIKNDIKKVFYKDNVFDSMGFKYYGPIDGNNFEELFQYFKYASAQDRPVILHVVTQKGLGFKPAMDDEIGAWHCTGPYNKDTGELIKNPNKMSFGAACSKYMIKFEEEYPNTRVVMPAMTYHCNMVGLKNKLGPKFIDTGITEQFATSFTASLAMNGMYTLLPIYSSFFQRAYDQLHQDICMQDVHAVIMVDKCGIVPGNGKTHQGIYDISYMSTIPNLEIIAPKDAKELYGMLEYAFLNTTHPVAIHCALEPIDVDNDEVNIKGNDISLDWKFINNIKNPKGYLITYSTNVNYIKDVMKDINVEVINARSIKPLDNNMLDELSKYNKPIFVYEDAPSETSLASLISYYYNNKEKGPKIIPLGFPLDYIDIGTIEEIRCAYKMDKESIKNRVKENL